jgi:hypothetical protein
MGQSRPGSERKSFVGVSEGNGEGPATLDEALFSAAEAAVGVGFVRPPDDVGEGGGPVWFTLSGLEVEIANQHVKTMRVTITER